MALILKFIALIIKLATLTGVVKTLVRLVKAAWHIFIPFQLAQAAGGFAS